VVAASEKCRKWPVTELERAGKRIEVEQPEKLALEIKGTKWIFTGVQKGDIIALDPSADPKCMDIKSVEKGRNGQIDEAIYKIEGDVLRICLYQGKGKHRPVRFKTTAEQSDTILGVLKKAKKE
jgi:uncharacterized protein (TIGR03067 family)